MRKSIRELKNRMKLLMKEKESKGNKEGEGEGKNE